MILDYKFQILGIKTTVGHYHSGPTEVEDCSLPPPNMATTKTGEQGKAWLSVL